MTEEQYSKFLVIVLCIFDQQFLNKICVEDFFYKQQKEMCTCKTLKMLCRIWGTHGGRNEDGRLQGSSAV
jgi:hypothetical protein